MAPTVRDNPDRFRFEILVDDNLVGFSEYRIVQTASSSPTPRSRTGTKARVSPVCS